ncbi:MAG TPA: nitronate monooxygenase [Nocardioides sp.]|uniref:nitronate monooxygenase n=1 Tax=Nocardioides sp. TaxID=35761 RepID=UPI002F3FAE6C
MSWLKALGATSPVVAAPMAGGPTTPELVLAAAGAGSLGFVAGGYLTADALADQLARVSTDTDLYGVNLFAPNPVPVDRAAYTAYRELIRAEAERYDVELPAAPVEDDDGWRDKVDLLLEHPVPVVSFTFGIPDARSLSALRGVGSLLVQTVTSEDEARQADAAGVDALAVQAGAAGGHSGTLTPDRIQPDRSLTDLVLEIGTVTELPMLAAGGIASSDDVAAVLAAGAAAVVVGTTLLLSDESGASSVHRTGLRDHDRETVVMRAWTGRPARGLRNAFSDAYDASAPTGYPALHHLTRPIRRAAAAASDPERVNLWAGTGFRAAREAPTAEILTGLAEVSPEW